MGSHLYAMLQIIPSRKLSIVYYYYNFISTSIPRSDNMYYVRVRFIRDVCSLLLLLFVRDLCPRTNYNNSHDVFKNKKRNRVFFLGKCIILISRAHGTSEYVSHLLVVLRATIDYHIIIYNNIIVGVRFALAIDINRTRKIISLLFLYTATM